MKKCSKCGESKDKNEFNKDSSRKDGLRHNCKVCHRLAVKKYDKTPKGRGLRRCTVCENFKKLDEFGKHKQYKDGVRPECKECKAKMQREWRDANPGKAAGHGKDEEHKERDDKDYKAFIIENLPNHLKCSIRGMRRVEGLRYKWIICTNGATVSSNHDFAYKYKCIEDVIEWTGTFSRLMTGTIGICADLDEETLAKGVHGELVLNEENEYSG